MTGFCVYTEILTYNREIEFMKPIRYTVYILVIVSALLLPRANATSLRCGTRLITEGDYKARVLAECGEPDHVDVWEEERVYRYFYIPEKSYRYSQSHLEPRYLKDLVIIEIWTYNHGRYRFMDHVRFENGRVRNIESGDYGY